MCLNLVGLVFVRVGSSPKQGLLESIVYYHQ